MLLEATNLDTLEQKVTNLLCIYAINEYAAKYIAPLVAKTSLMPNHLYEDLGFESRTQMGRFMALHFPRLAQNKPKDKLWKKYIYDLIGEVAPACEFCKDSVTCFSCRV